MSIHIVWFRRDLRWNDHTALAAALDACEGDDRVMLVFHINPKMTKSFSQRHDYFYESLKAFVDAGKDKGVSVHFLHGEPEEAFRELLEQVKDIRKVHFNKDESGAGRQRDQAVQKLLEAKGVSVHLYTDHHLHGAEEVTKEDGSMYQVFTPYYRKWRSLPKPELRIIDEQKLQSTSIDQRDTFAKGREAYNQLMQQKTGKWSDRAGEVNGRERLKTFLNDGLATYHEERDVPAIDGTSRLSPYLRTGALSPRMVHKALQIVEDKYGGSKGADTFIQELAWRDFYNMIYYAHPNGKDEEWNQTYRNLDWSYDEEELERWKRGETGFPIVDAAMRQLQQEGWMHNRLRMVVASFLTKDLLLDWRLGERHFEEMLIDYDPASNIGGWQWAASTGTGAVPYFRVFNPTRQSERFDPDGTFIKMYLPELKELPLDYIHEPHRMSSEQQEKAECIIGKQYPEPMVNHKERRRQAIEMFEGEKT
ncbi:cryptochrome/photolyase family protein [Shouchella shacheensis]|uniref:cryptochrome/photolyase family protein n=1 Tax=Shouchella shacheensis TaxID=1649580 RepID=UPI00073FB1C0|nr:deoxyribodipyrimidine photo-lyase [Shouchella shacheensis]